jgi:hypothetical protein
LPLALFAALLIANMSGDWIAGKLVWLVLGYALASGKWPVPGRRWVAPDKVLRPVGVNARLSPAGTPATALPLVGGR